MIAAALTLIHRRHRFLRVGQVNRQPLRGPGLQQAQTGCQVTVKYGQTSDEMFHLMQSGNYDGVSASGDASNTLMVTCR